MFIKKGELFMNTSNITNYKPKDFAELLGVSVKTLQHWDRDGILKANRTPTNRRYYTYDQYLQLNGHPNIMLVKITGLSVTVKKSP